MECVGAGALYHSLGLTDFSRVQGIPLGIEVEPIPEALPGLISINVTFRWYDGRRLLIQTISVVAEKNKGKYVFLSYIQNPSSSPLWWLSQVLEINKEALLPLEGENCPHQESKGPFPVLQSPDEDPTSHLLCRSPPMEIILDTSSGGCWKIMRSFEMRSPKIAHPWYWVLRMRRCSDLHAYVCLLGNPKKGGSFSLPIQKGETVTSLSVWHTY